MVLVAAVDLTETDGWRTRLARGAATHLSSHARHPRPAPSDKTQGSHALPGRQPQRESARRPVATITSASDVTDSPNRNSKPQSDSHDARARSHRELARAPTSCLYTHLHWVQPSGAFVGRLERPPAVSVSFPDARIRSENGSGVALGDCRTPRCARCRRWRSGDDSRLGWGLRHMSTDTFCSRRPSCAPARRRLAHLQPARRVGDLGGPPAARRRRHHDHRPLLRCDDLKPC
jgi:hypothetical protein